MSSVPSLPSDRERAISSAISQIEKLCGVGAVMRFGDKKHISDLELISTGSLGLDMALGIGGLPCGRIVEIYGPESSGKTTLALHIMAEAQRNNGGVVGFIDAEHAFSPSYAQKIGVNLKDLIISQPDSGEQALEIADKLVSSSAINVLVIDSVAALVPKAELEGNMGDSHMGLQARMMGQALRKLVGPVSRSKCLVVFINQTRQKIGVMFGNPETTTGGQALKFYASIRLDIRRTGTLKEKENSVGNQTRVKIVKNKLAAPFRVVDFDILYGEGISKEGEIIDWGSKLGILDKAGAWYSFQGTRLGQGREATRRFLKENPSVAAVAIQKIRAHEAIEDEFLKEETSEESDPLPTLVDVDKADDTVTSKVLA